MVAAKTEVQEIRGLTAIRGLAAWWIVFYHFREALPAGTPPWLLGAAARGFLAVDLFFELSGFVIALNYADRFQRVDLRTYWRFLGLRLARIYPLHLFMLCLFILNPIAILLFSDQGILGYQYGELYFALSLVLMQNWGFTADLAWNVPAWSISTEWFAYLLFPGMIWLTSRIARNAKSAILFLLLLLLILAGFVFQAGEELGGNISGLGLLRCVLEFWAGVCLFYFWRYRRGRENMERNLSRIFALVCFAACLCLGIPDYIIMPLGFAFLIYWLTDNALFRARRLVYRLIMIAGELSYATYLCHYFVKDWIKFLLLRLEPPAWLTFTTYIIIVAAASAVLYHLVEVPGRRYIRSLIERGTPALAHIKA